MASVAVVLAVGAFPRVSASLSTEISNVTSLVFPNVEFTFPVIPIIGQPKRLIRGSRFISSCVSPLFEIAIITSFLVITPESP
jgi:hypothetical protein